VPSLPQNLPLLTAYIPEYHHPPAHRARRRAPKPTSRPRQTTCVQNQSQHRPSKPTCLTDRDREEIDANAKSTLRRLNASIRALGKRQAAEDMEAGAAAEEARAGPWEGGGRWGPREEHRAGREDASKLG
jgi:syntaxin 18